jgi:Mrp family chromosome partitioning ATPase
MSAAWKNSRLSESESTSSRIDIVDQTEKMPIRSVLDSPIQESRSILEPMLNIPSVTDLQAVNEVDGELVLYADKTSDAPSRVSDADSKLNDDVKLRAKQTQSIERKCAAPPESAQHRFDELKINFLTRYARDGVKSVLFVGTTRGDGTSTAAFNFAKSLAQDLDAKVLFINADLRAPAEKAESISSGLTSLANPEVNLPLPARNGNIHVLPSGRNYADPAVLFQSKRFRAFMTQTAPQFDFIVLDGAPLDEAPESLSLSTAVDGVVLVVDAQRTRRKIALRAKKRIEEVGGRLLGIVLNRRRTYVPDWLYKLI